jgi:dCTP deaminase
MLFISVSLRKRRHGTVIISGSQILKELNNTIFITPFDRSKLNSNSYNLSLDKKLKVYEDDVLGMKKKYAQNSMREIIIPDEGLILQPNRLYLGSTVERTLTCRYIPIIEGRSSVARLGLFVHITAGLGEAGFDGHWTLELTCVQPLRIYPNVPICQIYYNCIQGGIDLCGSKKYQKSTEAEPSKLYEELRD